MKINFIANFQNGYVGEVGDATHLAREMEVQGHTVTRVPQDIWKAYVEGEKPGSDWVLPQQADINIICKWHHFINGDYIRKLKEVSKAPVFYWVWDFMYDQGVPKWHEEMVKASDLYLGNDVRDKFYKDYNNTYYFPFDVADGDIRRFYDVKKKYEVTFFGSCIGQGDRIQWLKEINKTNPVKIFAWNYQGWINRGFDAEPAVYGNEFNLKVAESKIILGFSVESSCWGYWSNRVGKILNAGGFLLYQYAPGMELFLGNAVEYFSSIEEAQEKIDHYLIAEEERKSIVRHGLLIAQRFTSQRRIEQLMILCERYLKKGDKIWQT